MTDHNDKDEGENVFSGFVSGPNPDLLKGLNAGARSQQAPKVIPADEQIVTLSVRIPARYHRIVKRVAFEDEIDIQRVVIRMIEQLDAERRR